jgi:hypothetical protein
MKTDKSVTRDFSSRQRTGILHSKLDVLVSDIFDLVPTGWLTISFLSIRSIDNRYRYRIVIVSILAMNSHR